MNFHLIITIILHLWYEIELLIKRYRYGSKVYVFCLEPVSNETTDMLYTLESSSSSVITDSSKQPTTAKTIGILVYNMNSCTT